MTPTASGRKTRPACRTSSFRKSREMGSKLPATPPVRDLGLQVELPPVVELLRSLQIKLEPELELPLELALALELEPEPVLASQLRKSREVLSLHRRRTDKYGLGFPSFPPSLMSTYFALPPFVRTLLFSWDLPFEPGFPRTPYAHTSSPDTCKEVKGTWLVLVRLGHPQKGKEKRMIISCIIQSTDSGGKRVFMAEAFGAVQGKQQPVY